MSAVANISQLRTRLNGFDLIQPLIAVEFINFETEPDNGFERSNIRRLCLDWIEFQSNLEDLELNDS